MFVDERLTVDPEIVFSAGSHQDAIRMSYREFERLTHPTLATFASRASVPSTLTTIVIDPVCGAEIEERIAAGWSQLKYYKFDFCSESCKMEFDDNPHGCARPRL